MVLPYIFRIINFIKNQWFGSILFVLFILYILFGQINTKEYNKKVYDFNKKIKSTEYIIEKNKKIIDSLKKIDTIYINKIKIINKKQYEEKHIIDSLPTNELQSYFTERYPK